MTQEIITINTGVNSYLLKNGEVFVLIDAGYPAARAKLEAALKKAGCRPGNLKLIILTHGDVDHTGAAAYLRQKYGARIAMHAADAPMAAAADMKLGRKPKADRYSPLFKVLGFLTVFIKTGEAEKFQPDLTIGEGYDLRADGFAATVLHLPGHSPGSVGVLTDAGELCCGDLIYNLFNRPGFIKYIDDITAHRASIEKLRRLDIKTVYPGHGPPFAWARFLKRYNSRV